MKPAVKTNKALLGMAQEIDQHLRAVRRTLRRPVEAEFSRGGLTAPQRSVMHVLVRMSGPGGLSLKELSRQVGLAHSTVSGIVDRLEKQGLVERQKDRKDRRVSLIMASKVVRDYVRDTLPTLVYPPLVEALRSAKPGERGVILEGLRVLRRVLDS
jgi:DNA-binding MarR family transcriptional regulator